MSQTERELKIDNNVSSLVCPALNILRGIDLNIQNHECFYQSKVKIAINNLLKLIELEQDKR